MSEPRGAFTTTTVGRAAGRARPGAGRARVWPPMSRGTSYATSHRVTCVAENVAGFASVPGVAPSDDALVRLESVVSCVAATDLASLSDDALRGLLRRISVPLRQLSALRTRGAGELDARAVARVRPERVQRARQDNRRRLREELDLTPTEAKQATQTGRRLQTAPRTDREFASGRLPDAHARVITDTLAFVPVDRRPEVETRLVGLAARMDAIALGRAARRILAEIDVAAAQRRERVQHERRFVKVADGEDGSVFLSARLYGLQAEKLRTALDAFTLPDPANRQGRTFEQRAADGLENLLDAALQSGQAPTQHGVRPHVLVIVEQAQLERETGTAELGFTGPVTLASVRSVLTDCTVSRIVMGPDAVPIEAGGSVRTVPAGLWRALVARDRGCTWERCDAPPSWCHAAHGQISFRAAGRLSLDNAALLCRRHHRQFDHGPWRIDIDGSAVTYSRTDGPAPRPPP